MDQWDGDGTVSRVAITYREVRRVMRDAGWSAIRVRGSHEVWTHPDGGQVVVPGGGKQGKEVPVGTLATIRRATGLKELR